MRDVRAILLLAVILIGFAVLFARAGIVMLGGEPQAAPAAIAKPQLTRAEIQDRNGVRLAVQVDVPSVTANPQTLWDAEAAADTLAQIISTPRDTLAKRLGDTTREFVWVARDITPAQKQAILQSGVEGLAFVQQAKRAYPNGALAGHVLGYAGIDENGLAGVEYAYDSTLWGDKPEPIQLTLDSRVQSLVEKSLAAGMTQYQAKAGAAILLDRDGAILAMASAPSFDPNLAREYPTNAPERINQATASVYELGSVMKPLTVAYALEQGVVENNTIFPTARPYSLGSYKIKDTHSVGAWASLKTIITESSNIGTLHVYAKLGADGIRAQTTAYGFDSPVTINLPERATPLLPEYWNEVNAGSVAYGHGISLSPLHMAAAYTVFTNQGIRRTPYIRQGEDISDGQRVLSASVSKTMANWLGAVVADGTGQRAADSGYAIGGKTGTADMPFEGGYDEDRNVCSFASIFPLNDPRYVLLVTLVEPQAADPKEGHTASWNAAPLSAKIINNIAPILGMYATQTNPTNLTDQIISPQPDQADEGAL